MGQKYYLEWRLIIICGRNYLLPISWLGKKKRLCLVRGEKVEEREVGNEERKEEK